MKKIVVTGGAGFIGSHTVDLLLKNNYHVIVLDNLSTGKLSNLDVFHPHLEMIQCDILDMPRLAKEIARCQIVLHLAALPSVPKSIEDPLYSHRVNMLGFLQLLEAIRLNGVPMRLVYASSAAVYGNLNAPPCSDEVPLPECVLSPYALEKANNERYAALYNTLYGIKSLGLRYFNAYGPRQDPKSPYSGVISKFMSDYAANKDITVFGDGEQSRDFIYVEDIAKANLLAVESTYHGVLNIATGIPETLNHLIHYIEKTGNHPANTQYLPVRAGDISNSYAATQKAEQVLKFRYSLSLEEGVKRIAMSEQKP